MPHLKRCLNGMTQAVTPILGVCRLSSRPDWVRGMTVGDGLSQAEFLLLRIAYLTFSRPPSSSSKSVTRMVSASCEMVLAGDYDVVIGRKILNLMRLIGFAPPGKETNAKMIRIRIHNREAVFFLDWRLVGEL